MRKWSDKLAPLLLVFGGTAIALGLLFAFTGRSHLQSSYSGDMFFVLGIILWTWALLGSIQEMKTVGRILLKLVRGR